MGGLVRVFFALRPTEVVRRAVESALAPFRASALDVTWERTANLHVTLRFVGEVEEATLPRLVDAVAPCIARAAPAEVILSGGGAFPDIARPRVLWVGAAPAEGLAGLVGAMSEGLARVGVAPEKRPYTPHLTVGMLAGGPMPPGFLEIAEVTRFRPSSVVLFQTVSDADGPLYLPVTSIPLRNDAGG